MMFAMGLDSPRRPGKRLLWLGVPTTLAWAVVGWTGTLGLLDNFRLMSLNRVGSWGADGGPAVSLVLFFSVAITVASSLGFAMLWSSGFSLSRMGMGFRASSLAAALGIAIGGGLASPSWTEPEAVGKRLGFLDGPAQEWSQVDWIVYYEPYLVPGIAGVIALVLILLLLKDFLAVSAADDRAEALQQRGRLVTGYVTHVEFTNVWVMGNPQFKVHVTYPGETGERTVVTTMITSAFQAPSRGSTVKVRYDPQDPDSVLVEPDPQDRSAGRNPGGFVPPQW
ncbi:Protein of unknown function [Amycolatopsis xylanica]|uniref:DUF3592 domain-containing protein n=2 Tax=Amycolatopsis xylanica TaxID=589385 RepID=A0A1H2TUL1_9PSEU|nr:Protein of unknown function [Amycolatopsis xylanica]